MTIPTLPVEIHQLILANVHQFNDPRSSLAACTLVNYTYNLYATPLLYGSVTITSPRALAALLEIANDEAADALTKAWKLSQIRHLDLSGYSTVGSRKAATDVKHLVVPEAMLRFVRACVGLRTFVIGESLERLLTEEVVMAVMACKDLRTVDFVGCSGRHFTKAMIALGSALEATTAATANPAREQLLLEAPVYHVEESTFDNKDASSSRSPPISRRNSMSSIISIDSVNSSSLPPWLAAPAPPLTRLPARLTRLGLHDCTTLPEQTALAPIISRLPTTLTHLDLSNAKVGPGILTAIPTANLTHLSLQKCKGLTCDALVPFLQQCPRLEYLSLYADPEVGGSSICEDCLLNILATCPSVGTTLRHLDFGGASLGITDRVLEAVAIHATPVLRSLGIAGARRVTLETGIAPFLAADAVKTSLRHIDLVVVPAITAAAVAVDALVRATERSKSVLECVEIGKEVFGALPEKIGDEGWVKRNSGRRCAFVRPCVIDGGEDPTELMIPRKVDVVTTEGTSVFRKISPMSRYYSFSV